MQVIDNIVFYQNLISNLKFFYYRKYAFLCIKKRQHSAIV